MKIYSLVKKSYDWYLFQHFFLSTTHLEKIHNEIKKRNFKDIDGKPYEVLFEDKEGDKQKSSDLGRSETAHWYVFVNDEDCA